MNNAAVAASHPYLYVNIDIHIIVSGCAEPNQFVRDVHVGLTYSLSCLLPFRTRVRAASDFLYCPWVRKSTHFFVAKNGGGSQSTSISGTIRFLGLVSA